MAKVVDSIVRRHMKRTSRFTVFDGAQDIPFAVPPEEKVIGWYRNPPPWEKEVVLFTWQAIWCLGDELVRLPIAELVDYRAPESKTSLTGVHVILRNGDVHFVRVAGSGSANAKDAFSFVMVVRALAAGRTSAASEPSPKA